MMQEINPKDTTRAYAFEMWMKAPMPMVTLIKTLYVTRLRHISKLRVRSVHAIFHIAKTSLDSMKTISI